MSVTLHSEFHTHVYGDDTDGKVVIEQTLHDGTVHSIFLSINQFESICHQKDELVGEALGAK